jgi:polyhydroxyalkanoate synthesis repressor PhaR
MAKKKSNDDEPISIKKYANRRLYNTSTSSYVTLEDLGTMVKEGRDFVVNDAKTGEDITRSVLTQIIFEEESKGQNLLPISFLRQLISFYGDSLQNMLPSYLEMSMEAFSRNQGQMRSYLDETFGEANMFRQMEDAGRQNAVLFQQAMNILTPFNAGAEAADEPPGAPANEPPEAAAKDRPGGHKQTDVELDALRQEVEKMRQQLDRIAGDED